jgi:hypothetical protein
VFFVFDPDAAWEWCRMSEERRAAVEERIGAGAVISPRRWNLLGVAQRLRQRELLDTKQVCEGILEATGGWPWLLDHVFQQFDAGADPREVGEMMGAALAPDGTLTQNFRKALGVNGRLAPELILKLVISETQGAPIDLIVPAYFGDVAPNISPVDCSASVEFLKRMGCIEVRDGLAHAVALVGRVPSNA